MEKLTEAVGQSINHIAAKASSGRLIATVILNGSAAYMLTQQIPIPDAMWAMLGVITTFYFTKTNP